MPRSSVSGSSAAGSNDFQPHPQPTAQADEQSAPATPPSEPNDIVPIGPFGADDGDVLLLIQGETIATHKYLLRQFAKLNEMVILGTQQTTGTRPMLALSDANIGVHDFRDAFSILYSNPLQGLTRFETAAFESALRLATMYDYPELRTYAINHLEQANLDPVMAIKIARECNVSDWIEPACMKLVEREEMPGAEECAILGLDTFRDIALKREEVRRRKLEALNPRKANTKPRSSSNGTAASHTPEPLISSGGSVVDPEEPLPRPDSKLSIQRELTSSSSVMSRKERVKAFPTKPCFLNAARPEVTLSPQEAESLGDMPVCLFVGDCRCRVLVKWQDPYSQEWKTEKRATPCRLPPCAALAFKNLQKVQMAYAERMQNLESLFERIASDPTFARMTAH